MRRIAILAPVAALAVAACSSTPPVATTPQPAAETVAVSVGPCFGFCPVYDVAIAPDGEVVFIGQRHTAVVGERRRAAGLSTYRSVLRDLAPFRPATGGEAAIACDAAISDTSSYTITWTEASGRRTVAMHHSGCTGGPGHDLDFVLRSLPDRLGIAGWAKQVTRPGASRG